MSALSAPSHPEDRRLDTLSPREIVTELDLQPVEELATA